MGSSISRKGEGDEPRYHPEHVVDNVGEPDIPGVHNIEVAIPPEVAQYATDIQRFVDAMVYKLSVHHKKGKWEDLPIQKALELLRGEERELTEAIERGNMVEIMLESADVANFALIISAIAMEKK